MPNYDQETFFWGYFTNLVIDNLTLIREIKSNNYECSKINNRVQDLGEKMTTWMPKF